MSKSEILFLWLIALSILIGSAVGGGLFLARVVEGPWAFLTGVVTFILLVIIGDVITDIYSRPRGWIGIIG